MGFLGKRKKVVCPVGIDILLEFVSGSFLPSLSFQVLSLNNFFSSLRFFLWFERLGDGHLTFFFHWNFNWNSGQIMWLIKLAIIEVESFLLKIYPGRFLKEVIFLQNVQTIKFHLAPGIIWVGVEVADWCCLLEEHLQLWFLLIDELLNLYYMTNKSIDLYPAIILCSLINSRFEFKW